MNTCDVPPLYSTVLLSEVATKEPVVSNAPDITSVEFYLLYYAELNAEQRQADHQHAGHSARFEGDIEGAGDDVQIV